MRDGIAALPAELAAGFDRDDDFPLSAEVGPIPVEFAGWLPIYDVSGNCGKHPQFTHSAKPPEGYCFTRSVPATEEQRPGLLRRVAGRLWSRLAPVVRKLSLAARWMHTLSTGPKV